jgi:hypothetical protein
MTVIAIRDGIMAVDSNIAHDGCVSGEVIKWRAVPDFRGGGYVAGAGRAAKTAKAIEDFVNSGAAPDADSHLLHLKQDGSVATCEDGIWYSFDAPFYAEGSGAFLAMAAMHAGATAKEACEIAVKMRPSECGGTIHVLRVGDK